MNHDRRISHIGGINRDGSHWHMAVGAAIAAIEAGHWSFYIERDGHQLPVIVAASRYGTRYIKTAEDKLHPDSLLALPECR